MRLVIALFLFFLGMIPFSAQVTGTSDFHSGDISLKVDPYQERIIGSVKYSLEVDGTVDSVFLDARNMDISRVKLNGRKIRYSYDGRYLTIKKKFRRNKDYALDISYSCNPQQAVYFLGWKDTISGNEQVWTQGQGKYNSHWVPSFDQMTEKVQYDIEIEFDGTYQVISNGTLTETLVNDLSKTWRYEMEKPMSSYLLAFAAGNYESISMNSESGIPISLYYYPKDSLLVEPTYRFTKEIFDFLERKIGVPYPWQNYKEVPVRDFLYAGMENTGATLFSDSYMIDSMAFVDRNFVNVNAHELTHQWFGNLVTETDASNHWLHEGFATYFSWLAEKEFLGKDHFYWMLFDKAETLEKQAREEMGESLLDPKASSLTFYDKGAMAILMLGEQLGEEEFRRGMIKFLRTYSYKNATVEDLISILETSSRRSLLTFRETWLKASSFAEEEVITYLRQEYAPIDVFLKVRGELIANDQPNEEIISNYWKATESSEFRKRMILLYHRYLSDDFLKEAFLTNDLKIRQALSLIPWELTEGMMSYYESLLEDKSYLTLENALYKLWIYRPDKREIYLDKTKGIIGFPDKNIRQLWLLLAILTKDYGTVYEQEGYRKELMNYTAPPHPMDVRQLAFGLIGEVFDYSENNLRDLVNAAVHPAWQFRQFARNILKDQIRDEKQRKKLEFILDDLKGAEFEYLSKELKQ